MTEQTALVESEDALTGNDVEPFEIRVTEAGSITTRLYALLRQVLTILENPEHSSASYRQSVADAIRMELEGLEEDGSDSESWFDTED